MRHSEGKRSRGATPAETAIRPSAGESALASPEHALGDAQLLALVMRSGGAGKSALELADELLAHAGGLRELLDADPSALAGVPGVGRRKLAELAACRALLRRYQASRMQRGATISSPREAHEYFACQLGAEPQEIFACLYLDARNRVIRFERLFNGTIDGASVHPRELVRQIIRFNAAALIVGHNHPSGVAEPSAADRALTKRIQAATSLLDVRLLDHLVVGDGCVVSFAERGWL